MWGSCKHCYEGSCCGWGPFEVAGLGSSGLGVYGPGFLVFLIVSVSRDTRFPDPEVSRQIEMLHMHIIIEFIKSS